MRDALTLLSLHPVYRILLAVMFLGFAAAYTAAIAPISADLLGNLEDFFAEEPGLEGALMGFMIGNPWLALVVGVVVGSVSYAFEKRRLRLALAEADNVVTLAEWFQLSAEERGKTRRRSWAPFRAYRPILLGIGVVLVAAWFRHFCVIVALWSFGIPLFITSPEVGRVYGAVVERLTDPAIAGAGQSKRWSAVQRRARTFLVVFASLIACVLVVLCCLVLTAS